MFVEAIEAILETHCMPEQVRAIERGASPEPLTEALRAAGFLELLAAEDAGGGGMGWPDFHEVVTLCGRYAVPIPLPQTLAARLLVHPGELLPDGLITFAPLLARGDDGSLLARHVPGGCVASHVLATREDRLVLLATSEAHCQPSGVSGSLAASLRWKAGAGGVLDAAVSAEALLSVGALLHAGLLAGAMQRAFALSMAYANERTQFGKPIGKFQAIQQQLSVMAEHVAAGSMAAAAAFGSHGAHPALPACAVAKARTSEAAQLVASIAHAVHGAIGVTAEYELQLYTRRLHEWRMAHGSESYWNRELGRLFVHSDAALASDFVRGIF